MEILAKLTEFCFRNQARMVIIKPIEIGVVAEVWKIWYVFGVHRLV